MKDDLDEIFAKLFAEISVPSDAIEEPIPDAAKRARELANLKVDDKNDSAAGKKSRFPLGGKKRRKKRRY